MFVPSQISNFDITKVLFIFALESEAGDYFKDKNVIFTGIGKVNAAINTLKGISKFNPELIINLGTAGSNVFLKHEIVNCCDFVQRDMDVCGLGFKMYETPFSKESIILNYGIQLNHLNQGTCGTGDSFDTNLKNKIYNVVDMEAYAIALIAKQQNIPFLCLKYISDGADENAAESWTENVINSAESFYNILFK